MCRQGGWSCKGRKDLKECHTEPVLNHVDTKIDFCDCIYKDRYDECKAKGFRPICTRIKSQCMSVVRHQYHFFLLRFVT